MMDEEMTEHVVKGCAVEGCGATMSGTRDMPDLCPDHQEPKVVPGSGGHDHIMQFFEYAHLPPRLQGVSREFYNMAIGIVGTIPASPERTVALRKLLESKDAAVRASLAGNRR